VNVHSEKFDSMTFTANSDDRVNKISEHVRSKTNIPVLNQVLQLGSKTLEPQRTLSSYGIDKETTIHLTLKVVKPSNEKLTLIVVDLSDEGQKYYIRARKSTSVSTIKQRIKRTTAKRPKTVTCNGKRLEVGKTMRDYRIKGGDFLFVTPYCKGG
ncbi:Ubiquitin D, partial [Galemys pyrenaicus]